MRIACSAAFGWALSLAPAHAAHAADEKADEKQVCREAAEQGQELRLEHKPLAARAFLEQCARAVCPRVVREDCEGWRAENEGLIPTVVLIVEDEAGVHVTDARVTLDGAVLAPVTEPLEVEAGEHVFAAERLGARGERRIVVAEGRKGERVHVRLRGLSPPADVPWFRAKGAAGVVGLGAVGLGGAGLVAGTVFGLRALSQRSDAGCSGLVCPNASAAQTLSDAQTAGTVSTALFVVGAATAASGLVLWLLAPRTVIDAQPTREGATVRVHYAW